MASPSSTGTPVCGLSVADPQLVEIAEALSLHARVLVMDEPTASLSAREVDRLFSIARQLRAQGVAIQFVSYGLDEIFALSDRVTVLRDGGQYSKPNPAHHSVPRRA